MLGFDVPFIFVVTFAVVVIIVLFAEQKCGCVCVRVLRLCMYVCVVCALCVICVWFVVCGLFARSSCNGPQAVLHAADSVGGRGWMAVGFVSWQFDARCGIVPQAFSP